MKPLAAILLILCLTAQADPSQRAQEAAIADVAECIIDNEPEKANDQQHKTTRPE